MAVSLLAFKDKTMLHVGDGLLSENSSIYFSVFCFLARTFYVKGNNSVLNS